MSKRQHCQEEGRGVIYMLPIPGSMGYFSLLLIAEEQESIKVCTGGEGGRRVNLLLWPAWTELSENILPV